MQAARGEEKAGRKDLPESYHHLPWGKRPARPNLLGRVPQFLPIFHFFLSFLWEDSIIANIYHDGFFDREADAGTIEPDGVMDRYATMNYKP
jgi:hypothetical protein